MIRGRSAGVGFVVCALAGVLAGCDGDAASQPTTSAVASPSGVSSSASTPSSAMTTPSTTRPRPRPTVTPAVPAAARRHSAAGAEAFARFYLEQVNRAWATANPELIRPYAAKTCKTCANQIRTAVDLRRSGQRYANAAGALGASIVTPESTRGRVVVELPYDQLAVDVLDRAGRVVQHMPAIRSQSQVTVTWGPGQNWQVAEIKLAPLS